MSKTNRVDGGIEFTNQSSFTYTILFKNVSDKKNIKI